MTCAVLRTLRAVNMRERRHVQGTQQQVDDQCVIDGAPVETVRARALALDYCQRAV